MELFKFEKCKKYVKISKTLKTLFSKNNFAVFDILILKL